MSTLEQIFATAELDVVVPDTSLQYPPTGPADEWLSQLKRGTLERTQAFFDEQLHALLTVRVDQPPTASSRDAALPPKELLSFLSHLQISLEATYISSVPVGPSVPETPRTARLSAPPRTASLAKLSARSAHPPIFPPNTPNPTPSSAETDRRYLRSEGTLLLASIWGQNASSDSQEAFSLLWSEEEEVWVAVYRLSLTVSFLRLAVNDPLLCLTISATLRDRPQTLSRPNHPLALFLASVDFQVAATAPASPTSPTAVNGDVPAPDAPPAEPTLSGLPELNLLEGLSAGPSFASSALGLPTARLGSVSRLKLFTLQPLAARSPLPAPSPSPMTAIGRSAVSAAGPGPATLRKSFRKTLRTVSGFRVRMRTVFVPAVLLPLGEGIEEDTDEDRDRLEAGTDERTIVLCVELENSGDSGRTVGFEVESVDVSVGGGDDAGARAVLVGWGSDGVRDNGSVFPMRVGASEQYNLLYAVSFLRSPDEALAMGLVKDGGVQDMLQRAVTIGIFGKPYLTPSSSSSLSPPTTPKTSGPSPVSTALSYPTRTFCSKWNCVLDLSSQPHPEPEDDLEDGDMQINIPNALPEPASPFPSNPRVRTDSLINISRDSPPPTLSPQTATKRHTLPGGQPIVAARALGIKSPGTGLGYRASTSMLNPLNSAKERGASPPLPVRSSSYNSTQYTPPSVTAQAQMPRSPTTYAAPPRLSVDPEYQAPVPMTPAYPSYPTRSALPPTPPAVMAHTHSQGVPGGSTGGRSVEIRRERGMPLGTGAVGVPQTPGPIVSVAGGGGGFFGLGPSASEAGGIREEDEYGREHERGGDPSSVKSGEGIVVSVGLVASGTRKLGGDLGKTADVGYEAKDGDTLQPLYPLDRFTLDVFVFNQSEWTRRFEVTCPDRRRGRGPNPSKKIQSPGIVPLDNRVRIGPLLPAACQSVRMEFLAVTPGVHSISTLTLTDVVSGYSMNLRSVMDIVVHEPGDI
ncbi:TRAPP trafficking subunit Trs65-domain-containing protein [Mycena maculata]|uniref:TRAPP trafficking subunit Trs65-domain-containing protein n=1 Tax=Mycena maculata TaxID=230809 RepID=A0AAD7IZU3_9AGAR|nr:TRAPP trafficking subunit Trs65-domain-containing protein [Mycena maculata]